MYSWAGQSRFDDRGLTSLVPRGAISSGSFFSYLASIFGGNGGASFSYLGDTTIDGKLLAEFSYRVPVEKSTYTFWYGKAPDQYVTTGYDGTFLLDPENCDLVRLTIRTGELPSETRACQVTQVLNYRRVHLYGAEFLLPMESHSSLIRRDRSRAENHAVYSACHEFHGEATMSFVDAENEPDLPRDPPAPKFIPGNLAFRLVFTEPINTALAATGDVLKAKLKSAIRDTSGNRVAPEGSAVMARIVKMQYAFNPAAGKGTKAERGGPPRGLLTIAVKLESLEAGGIRQDLAARIDTGTRRFVKMEGFSVRVEIGHVDPADDPETAVFEFSDVSQNYVVDAGLESDWLTLSHGADRRTLDRR
jgi:hypothetical protein